MIRPCEHCGHSYDESLAQALDAEREAHGKTQLALDEAVAWKDAAGQKALQLREQLDKVTAYAADMLTSLSCERHEQEVRALSFDEFHAQEVARGCIRCAIEQRDATNADLERNFKRARDLVFEMLTGATSEWKERARLLIEETKR